MSVVDMPLLYAFQGLVSCYSSVTTRTRRTNFETEHTSATWTVCSLAFRDEIKRLGIPAGKKSTCIAPPPVSFSARDYYRGLVDADGSVGITATGLPLVSLCTSSPAIIEGF